MRCTQPIYGWEILDKDARYECIKPRTQPNMSSAADVRTNRMEHAKFFWQLMANMQCLAKMFQDFHAHLAPSIYSTYRSFRV